MMRFLIFSGLLFTSPSFAQVEITLINTNPSVSCFGDSDGDINISVSGGQTPYSYDWDNDGTGDFDDTEDLAGLTAGTYTIIVLDDLGNDDTLIVVVDTPTQINFNYISNIPPTCGWNNGSFEIGVTGGIPPYIFSIDNNVTQNTTGLFQNLFAGLYTVIVTDFSGCQNSTFIALSDTPQNLSVSLIVTPPSCSGASDASITTNIWQGTPPLSFDWDMDGTGDFDDVQNPINLSAGTYTVVVEDGCFNQSTETITIIDSLPITITTDSIVDVTCFGLSDGSVNLSVTNGTPPYTYDWDIDGTGDFDDSEDQINLGAGPYNLEVKDANGCLASHNILISNGSIVDVSVNIVDFTITANESGTYQWTTCPGFGLINGETNESFTATQNGSYAVIITNTEGCIDTSVCYQLAGIGFDENLLESVNLYPNPTAGFVRIQLSKSMKGAISILNINGSIIQELSISSDTILIDLTGLDQGVYFLQINLLTGLINKKIVVQR